MAISEPYANTQAVDTTEWSLTADSAGVQAQTDDGVYQLLLDLSDMVAGDILQIRCYEKVRSANSQRVLFEVIFKNAQAEPNWASPSLILMHGWDFTADALAGTITVDWSIRKVA